MEGREGMDRLGGSGGRREEKAERIMLGRKKRGRREEGIVG